MGRRNAKRVDDKDDRHAEFRVGTGLFVEEGNRCAKLHVGVRFVYDGIVHQSPDG